ncbi:zinc finger protein 664-like [Mesocricetus auratus]|uniref:Zinc finger protein 664-like n=1 Tax=Mesocricetus auratus TaxID=10036 RepID=A0ABM2WQI9_MESAU|nr:zinc finger protein 664-like [Mesocricetus auratus]
MHHECDINQEPITENIINKDMDPGERGCESPLHVRNIIGHSSSHGYLRDQTTGTPSVWKKAMAKAFIRQEHWKNTHHSGVLETSQEKPCESQEYNEPCGSLSLDQPQEGTHTGVTLNDNDLRGHTHVQNDEGIHKEVKQFVCKLCDESFIDSSDLNNHEKSHIGQERYSGRQCGKTFKNAKRTKGRIYTCKNCQKTFTSSTVLKKHIRIHTGEKPYVCKHCGKAFTTSSNMTVHERIHTGVKPYACKHCGKAFSQSNNHKTHERTHTGEKPYTCRHCGKAFGDLSSHKGHERRHTVEKPHVCKHCGKAFILPNSLKLHERVHTGEKPYSCRHCGKAFSMSYYHKKHERNHTR